MNDLVANVKKDLTTKGVQPIKSAKNKMQYSYQTDIDFITNLLYYGSNIN